MRATYYVSIDVAAERSSLPRGVRRGSLVGRSRPRRTPPSPPRTLPPPGSGPVCPGAVSSGPPLGLEWVPLAPEPEARQRDKAWEAPPPPAVELAVPPRWGPPYPGPEGLAPVYRGGCRKGWDVVNRGQTKGHRWLSCRSDYTWMGSAILGTFGIGGRAPGARQWWSVENE